MDNQFTINVKVELNFSAATAELLRTLLTPVTPVVEVPAPRQRRKKVDTPAPEEEAPAQEAQAPAEVAAPAPEAEAPAPAPAEDPLPKIPSEEDVRQAMYKTRARIEGEDWKEKSSETYKKYHKALTELFIKLATSLGSERPSALPMDKRQEFIQSCECIKVGADGIVYDDLPF